MFMTPTESAKFFKQINSAFDELKTRVTTLESQLEKLEKSKTKNGNNTKTQEKAWLLSKNML